MSNVLPRVTLGLNVLVMATTFVLALGAQSSQVDLLGSVAFAGSPGARAHGDDAPPPIAYLRLLQTVETLAPKEKLDAFSSREMDAVYQALEHHHYAVASGVRGIIARREDGAKTRAEADRIAKEARDGVHAILSAAFRDGEFVNRLTAAIVGWAR